MIKDLNELIGCYVPNISRDDAKKENFENIRFYKVMAICRSDWDLILQECDSGPDCYNFAITSLDDARIYKTKDIALSATVSAIKAHNDKGRPEGYDFVEKALQGLEVGK